MNTINKGSRSRTVSQQKYQVRPKRKLSNQLNLRLNVPCQNFSSTCFTPKSKEAITKQYSNRNSGKINVTPNSCKSKFMPLMEYITNQARGQLQKLQFRDKLDQVQSFFKIAQQLCKVYGYFYATFAMLQFNLQEQLKISVWIHPDIRSTRPLHPIKKQTQFECQIQCVKQLKNIINFFLPDVNLGDGMTFSNIIAYVQVFKAQHDARRRKQIACCYRDNTNYYNKYRKKKNNNNNGVMYVGKPGTKNQVILRSNKKQKYQHIKTQPQGDQNGEQEESLQYERNMKSFKVDTKNKQTKSTLIQSFKSVNSIMQKLKAEQQNQSKNKQHEVFGCELIDNGKKNTLMLGADIAQIKQILDDSSNQNRSPLLTPKLSSKQSIMRMKMSVSGKKLMTMSIEMQSQINNLFGAADDQTGALYIPNMDKKALKNSMLSKVAQQFQDLF